MNTNFFRTEGERRVTLTQKELENILKIDPQFESVSGATYFDNYDLPCPVCVSVKTKDNKVATVVLRKSQHGDIENEVEILRVLKEFGLPVPEVLAEPFKNEDGEHVAILSLLPGENLQKLSMQSKEGLSEAKELLVEAVVTLTSATDFIRKHEVSKVIPIISLIKELEDVNVQENPWFKEEVFQNAVQKLKSIIENITTPLVFSNGDYQPGNFLAQDGKISGFLDFESLSFQDPIMGFVKYPIYDLLPLSRTNIVKTFLDKKGFSEKDFNHRLALGCLKTLKKEIPVLGGNEETQEYRDRVLNLLNKSLDLLS
jgi:aminoglycoside phosphotransferase